jgi:hypothetical protein
MVLVETSARFAACATDIHAPDWPGRCASNRGSALTLLGADGGRFFIVLLYRLAGWTGALHGRLA